MGLQEEMVRGSKPVSWPQNIRKLGRGSPSDFKGMGTAAAGLAEPQTLELGRTQVPAPEDLSHSWLIEDSAGGPDMSSPVWSGRVHWGLKPS